VAPCPVFCSGASGLIYQVVRVRQSGQIVRQHGVFRVDLMQSRRFAEAAPLLRMAVDLLPDSAEAQNDLGVTLASLGRVGEGACPLRARRRAEA